MTRATIPQTSVPSRWLKAVLTLLNEMASDGIGITDCEDPAELMVEIAEYLGVGEDDDPWEASLLKISEALRG